MKEPLQTSFSVPHKSIDILKLQQMKLAFTQDIAQETVFSKYLQKPEFSTFFTDVLWYLNKNFALPQGYKIIFWYLVSDKNFAAFSSHTVLDNLPSYEQAEETLNSFKWKEQDFMNLNVFDEMQSQGKQDLYNWLIIFMQWIADVLSNFQKIDTVKWTVTENTNNLLTRKDVHELLWWFNSEIFHKIQTVPGFWAELSLFFKNKEISDIFDYGAAEKLTNILHAIHTAFLWKINTSYLNNIEISEVENLRNQFKAKKSELAEVNYMEMELPAIFWFVSDNNAQRSGYLIYVIEALLKDFSNFLSIYQRQDQVD